MSLNSVCTLTRGFDQRHLAAVRQIPPELQADPSKVVTSEAVTFHGGRASIKDVPSSRWNIHKKLISSPGVEVGGADLGVGLGVVEGNHGYPFLSWGAIRHRCQHIR